MSNALTLDPTISQGWAALACSSICSFSCPSCQYLGEGGKHALEENLFAIQHLAEKGFTSLLLMGADPLKLPHLSTLIDEARQLGFNTIWVSDCGYALGDPERPLETLDLDGVLLLSRGLSTSKINFFTKNAADESSVIKSLARLKQAGIPWHGLVEMVRPVLPEVPKILQTFAEYGAAGVSFHIPQMERLEAFQMAVPVPLVVRVIERLRPQMDSMGWKKEAHPAVQAWTRTVTPSTLMKAQGLEPAQLRVLMTGEAEDFLAVNLLPQREGKVRGEILMRIQGRCNMACSFCWLYRKGGPVPRKKILDVAEEQRRVLKEQGAEEIHLVLTGGEPTLHPDLVFLIEQFKTWPEATIEIQSNGYKLAEPGLARALCQAGMTSAQITLLSHDAAISDGLTHCKGGWEKTVAGIDALSKENVTVNLSLVVSRDNMKTVPETVAFIVKRWGQLKERLSINLLLAVPMGRLRDKAVRLISPSVGEARPYLEKAFIDGRLRGLHFGAFDVPCGFPLCAYGKAAVDLPRSPGDEAMNLEGFAKPPEKCGHCSLVNHCPGLFESLAQEYGTEDLTPIR